MNDEKCNFNFLAYIDKFSRVWLDIEIINFR